VIIVAVVAAYTLTRDEEYQSSADVQILNEENHRSFNINDETLYRNARSELQYVESSDYTQALRDLVGRFVEPEVGLRRLTGEEKDNEVGVLRFSVRDSEAALAAEGAAAAAEAYIDDRHQETVTQAEQRLIVLNNRYDVLSQERATLSQTLNDLRDQLANATTPQAQARLEAEIAKEEAEIGPSLDTVDRQIGQVVAEQNNVRSRLGVLSNREAGARLIRPAFIPQNPTSPNVPLNIMAAVFAGLVLGLIFAIVRELLDQRARDSAELAATLDVPVMATIGEIRSDRSAPGKVKRFADLNDAEMSGYKVLLNSLWLSNVESPMQSIAFTSDRAGVGKTQTVVNLAQAEAARGTRVLVVDTDFVNPSVLDRFGGEHPAVGLWSVLSGRALVDQAIVETEVDNVSVLDAVGQEEGSGDVLRSDRLGSLITDLYSRFDLILIDGPPTLGTSDSRVVMSQADAAVVVYDPSLSLSTELSSTIDLLRAARANLIGLVANRAKASSPVYGPRRD
jgi:capsular exopolysaccharide synthesis family protein